MGKAERLESFGNKDTMNFNEILYQNVQASQYLKNLRYVCGRAKKGAGRKARARAKKGAKGARRRAREGERQGAREEGRGTWREKSHGTAHGARQVAAFS